MAKIIEKEWIDFYDKPTVALEVEKDGLITISEMIELLQVAKEKFGDIEVLAQEQNTNHMGGFGCVYLNHEYDLSKEYGEDYKSPNQLVLFS